MNGVEHEAVRAHVARITASDLFAGAERLCRFLQFTVESKLAGRESHVKEYVLGREVFDRGNDYDTRLDPIVRVEARRLRARLAEYYSGPGRDEPLRLEYPKGSYVPVFSSADVPKAGGVSTSLIWVVLGLALALILAAGGVFWLAQAQRVALIAPIPARWIQPDDGTLDPADVALAEDLDAQLANRRDVGVVAWPELLRRNDLLRMPLRDVASEFGAAQLLVVLVRDSDRGKRVNVFLVDEPAGRKRLALTYTDPPLATETDRNALAARIAKDLVSQRP